MNIDWKNFFRAEDLQGLEKFQAERLVEEINQKLWAVLQCSEKAYGDIECGEYHGIPDNWDIKGQYPNYTHECRVIDVRRV